MHFTDPRFGKAMIERRTDDRSPKRRLSPADLRMSLQHRIGGWLIARGEKLVETKPKLA